MEGRRILVNEKGRIAIGKEKNRGDFEKKERFLFLWERGGKKRGQKPRFSEKAKSSFAPASVVRAE